ISRHYRRCNFAKEVFLMNNAGMEMPRTRYHDSLPPSPMAPCRVCTKDVARDAVACPHCGAPYPAKLEWDGWGYEYKSDAEILGIPLLHVSFKYRPNRMPVPARGIIAIGQFGFGIVNISQFGIGLFSRDTLLMSAMLLPLVPVGVWLGLHLLRRIPERPFFLFATWALALSGAKLLWDGLAG
ncbi:MAG TPA: hypothetical protein PK101_04650, partial [Thauera sp.]|nr:hypothetical protein [Thauera sp.]